MANIERANVSDSKLSKSSSKRDKDKIDKQTQINERVDCIEDLSDIISILLPELWSLGQSYFSGELHIKPDQTKQAEFKIPVYLSQDLADKLHIFQYPLNAAGGQNLNVIQSQIKPGSQEVILDVGLDTASANYDKSHGEKIANNIDRDKTSQNKTFSSNMMDRIRLESTHAIIDRDSYAVGIMRDKQLVISPIQGVVSLLPSFSHIKEETEIEVKAENIEKEQAEKICVKFSEPKTKKYKKAREDDEYRQKSAEEPWYHTEYHGVDSVISKMERAKLNVGNVGDTEKNLTGLGYANALLPREPEIDGAKAPDSFTSLNDLRQLPLPDQVKLVLFDVHVVNAHQLSCKLKTDINLMVKYLPTYAVMVSGNWVLRSDLLYSSTHNGIPPHAMIRARDYILYEFHNSHTVVRKSLSSLVGIPHNELTIMLSQVGVLGRNKGWHLRLPPDTAFFERFPNVVRHQNCLWLARGKALLNSLGINAAVPKQPRNRKDSEMLGATAASVAGKPRKSISSDSE